MTRSRSALAETGSAANPTDELPPALRSLWRTLMLGYRTEPRMLVL